ncbi:type III-B CRISPR module RAMP protein Cmr4 [Heliobacterium gestii]|uniref:Type III-B CRISPR module RAMP protein Cmr4 n=1 Tax=Heliomicrobium gestii TaxID=2699 RepID=A0A845L5W8_HELGE|nr:type III-B CRISPR module RAMP protein Cmr4 [Heliomicrobium gestii]MBM7865792.1 CRISPR-associated protein Cmr4 [Heliomicrobium gestii]MZP42037.1 type III-B CRISPR module RAMP protein Cmr4 [Heliomicrobium gestii]
MKNAIMGLLAETSLHPGAEQSTGVIDLPVAREVATGYPVLVGSSLKGALRNAVANQRIPDAKAVEELFGTGECAGSMAVTDARLLLLPVRSLTSHYKWVTCPYLLERFQRDQGLAGLGSSFAIPQPANSEAILYKGTSQTPLLLEEFSFKVNEAEQEISAIADALAPLIKHPSVQERLKSQLVVISDDEFHHFALYGLQVNARNQLETDTKKSNNLWYEETLPPDTLLYTLLLSRQEQRLERLKEIFDDHPYLQVGGNETIGQGWCAVSWLS